MEHVRNGKGRDFAFGAITEILLYKDKGLRFVGPLPADVQNYTPYVAALTPQGNAQPRRATSSHSSRLRKQAALRRRRRGVARARHRAGSARQHFAARRAQRAHRARRGGIVILLLIFAVPRAQPPPATLANPNEAFVDRAGIVSPAFAREWAGALLNDDRAEIVIYVDRKPPEGDLASWAIQTATDWKVGASKNDTGLVPVRVHRAAHRPPRRGLRPRAVSPTRAHGSSSRPISRRRSRQAIRARLRRLTSASARRSAATMPTRSTRARPQRGSATTCRGSTAVGPRFKDPAASWFRDVTRNFLEGAPGSASRSCVRLGWPGDRARRGRR
jgi:hypothetical protein